MLSLLFRDSGDAAKGVLAPGDEGIVLEDDKTSKPYKVKHVITERAWWYESAALSPYPQAGEIVTVFNARPGFKVVRGPDWACEYGPNLVSFPGWSVPPASRQQ